VAKAFSGLGVTAGLAADRTSMTGMVAGQQFFETDTELLFVYSNSTWKLLGGKTPHFRAGFTNAANTGLANTFTVRRNVGFSIVSSTRITPAYSGVYTILASQINDVNTTRYDLQIRKNGVTITQALNDNSSGYHYKQAGVSVELTAGVDYIELYADEYYNETDPNDFWKNCSLVWNGSI
jgi:hypothetical protein